MGARAPPLHQLFRRDLTDGGGEFAPFLAGLTDDNDSPFSAYFWSFVPHSDTGPEMGPLSILLDVNCCYIPYR